MSKWGDELPDYKAKKRGQIDAEKMAGKGKSKRKPKPWKVMGVFSGHEYVAHRGVDEAACKAWIEKAARSYYVRRQDQSGRAIGEAQARAIERANRYRIEAPN